MFQFAQHLDFLFISINSSNQIILLQIVKGGLKSKLQIVNMQSAVCRIIRMFPDPLRRSQRRGEGRWRGRERVKEEGGRGKEGGGRGRPEGELIILYASKNCAKWKRSIALVQKTV